jgi:predicted amidophosphoribosyltransferase
MSEVPGDLPPVAKPDVKSCPYCKRKLLTQTSALCNWCGKKIDDPDYQEKAALTRQQQDQHVRAQVEAAVQEDARYGILGRLKRRAKESGKNRSGNELTP